MGGVHSPFNQASRSRRKRRRVASRKRLSKPPPGRLSNFSGAMIGNDPGDLFPVTDRRIEVKRQHGILHLIVSIARHGARQLKKGLSQQFRFFSVFAACHFLRLIVFDRAAQHASGFGGQLQFEIPRCQFH